MQCDAAADALADTLAKLSSEDAAAHLTKLEMDDMLSLNLSLTLAQRLGSVVLELVGPWILDVVARGVANSDSAAEVVLLAHEASASLLDLESTRKLEEDGDCLRKLGNAECLVSLATGCLREHAWDEARFTEGARLGMRGFRGCGCRFAERWRAMEDAAAPHANMRARLLWIGVQVARALLRGTCREEVERGGCAHGSRARSPAC